ncbi:MAG: HIT domain-containing protein [Chloroflexi bacterium]|nr:HIT domain-containing protein [Chloroflexota bacterium]
MSDAECIFCRIARGELASSKVYEDEQTFAFMDVNQPTRGHVLIIPKQHYVNIFDIERDALAAVMETTRRVAIATKCAVNADGIQIWQSSGAAAMQEVFHWHAHVFARYEDDDIKRLGIRAAAKHPPRAELDALAQLIANQLVAR